MRISLNSLYRHLFALGCAAVAGAVRYALDVKFSGVVPFATFFPAVVVAGYFGGLAACATATIASVLIAWYLFVPPPATFAMPSPIDVVNLALFAIAAGFSGAVGALLHRQSRAARRAEARLRRAQNTGGVADWEWNLDTGEVVWSDNFFALLGHQPGAVPASAETLYGAMHPDDHERMHAVVGEAAKNLGRFETEFRVTRPDGSLHWLSTRAEAELGDDGMRRITGVVIDISKLKEAERQREMMFHELNHRVKNNFQVVGSLLRLQAARLGDSAARDHLNGAVQRVMTIADVHSTLYQSGHIDTLDLGQYLVGLCRKLQQTVMGNGRIAVDVQVISAIVKVDRAIPLGLVANELIANAVKHAFPDGRSGSIEVRLTRTETGFLLSIADNGIGLPENVQEKGGLGWRLIDGFVSQADGKLHISRNNGTRFDIALPDDGTAQRSP
jgi:PAS domain S-box-containing protein